MNLTYSPQQFCRRQLRATIVVEFTISLINLSTPDHMSKEANDYNFAF